MNTQHNRWRQWWLRHLPDGVLARPGEWFLAFLCLISGITSVSGLGKSEALTHTLSDLMYRAWGGSLLLGGICLMIGLSSIRTTGAGYHVITRVPVYRFACRLLATACVVYGAALAVQDGWAAMPTLLPLAGFVVMCWIRLLTLGGR